VYLEAAADSYGQITLDLERSLSERQSNNSEIRILGHEALAPLLIIKQAVVRKGLAGISERLVWPEPADHRSIIDRPLLAQLRQSIDRQKAIPCCLTH
jgi:hypothetical protein